MDPDSYSTALSLNDSILLNLENVAAFQRLRDIDYLHHILPLSLALGSSKISLTATWLVLS
jgi:hypothetical protein